MEWTSGPNARALGCVLRIDAALDSLALNFVDDAVVTDGSGIFAVVASDVASKNIAGAGVASAAVHR